MNMEDAIRAVIGRDASQETVDSVAAVLVDRGQREPGVAAIVDALAAVPADSNAAEVLEQGTQSLVRQWDELREREREAGE